MRETIVVILAIALLVISIDADARRTVHGTITDENGNPVQGLRVTAYDNDRFNRDDRMQEDITDANGRYTIRYAGRHWDRAPHWYTIWRPDIYINVATPDQDLCFFDKIKHYDWLTIGRSKTHWNHKIRNDLRIDLTVPRVEGPVQEFSAGTFYLGETMYCKVSFFLKVDCFGCTDTGKKVSWSDTGFGGLPSYASKCDTDIRDCSESDYQKIRELDERLSNPIDIIRSEDGNQIDPSEVGTVDEDQ